jgi:nucleotide-binding universal stress UspA family protein
MLPPKKILAPIDFSAASMDTLNTAADLALKDGSELCIAHVVPAIAELPSAVSMLQEREYEESLHAQAQSKLTEAAQRLRQPVRTRTIVGTSNDVGMEVVRLAEAENADLVVIATHGMTGWRPFVFGSVAEKVVRNASCPVLLLRAGPASRGEGSAAAAAAAY